MASIEAFAVGWTPTDGGLVVDLEQGDRFLLSVVVGDKEYFVCNYNRYTGGDFNYTAGLYLKLIPQAADATEPSEMSIWSAGAPLVRKINGKVDSLGGIAYTIWNDGKTLRTNNTNYQFMGDLTSDYNYKDACDVVFIVPTDHESITSFDPNRTLYKDRGRTDQESDGKINGKIGKGFLGMTYREVYLLDFPKSLPPMTYTNASLVTFNTTNKQTSWSNGQIKCDPGHAAYAFADDKHKPTTRTLFRLYLLDDPFYYCDRYFFATDEQDFKNYRNVETPKSSADSTVAKKIYTIDWMTPMKREGATTIHKTDYMFVPGPDSTYYYVGYNNDYKAAATGEKMGDDPEIVGDGAFSQFTKIRQLPIRNLSGFYAPAGAYGRMVLDSTETADNHAVAFEPAGYFLKVSTGTNVQMKPDPENPNRWISEEMWTITPAFAELYIKTMLMTGLEFSPTDSGAVVDEWSVDVQGKTILIAGTSTPCTGYSGWARIYTNNTNPNGAMEFVLANNAKHIHYDNNGFLGMQIPDQYPISGSTSVTVQNHRLKSGYTFNGWTTNADGTGTSYAVGAEIDLGTLLPDSKDSTLTLYAQATYNGTLQVALSFINPTDSKRYYITHPNSSAPRFARARHFEDWENTWQGMENAENLDPNYVSTFELRCPIAEIHKKEGDIPDLLLKEHVLDPRRYTMKGYEDSLTFYEFFAPAHDEYLGLYYTNPNTIVANNTWAGLFTTTATETSISWPDYRTPYIPHAKLQSTRYVEEYDPEHKKDSLILKERGNKALSYVAYDPATDQFNGVETLEEATDFELSAVVVADAHYIVVPDTTEDWCDLVLFDYHQDEQSREELWSKLIGKQLMAVMVVGGDTTYFHPNRNKIIDAPNNLYLSSDFRVTQTFELIPDAKVTTVMEEDRPTLEETSHYWCYHIVSGWNSPMDVKDANGNYIDIIDTFRVSLSHGGISKIKEYRGRWNENAPGVKMKDGVRYRDILVRTKTYHYGAEQTKFILTPAQTNYSFNPFQDQPQQIDFKLTKVTTRQLLDVDGNSEREETISSEDVTTSLAMLSGKCSFTEGSSYFRVDGAGTSGAHVTVVTQTQNDTPGDNNDTLHITGLTVTISGETYPVEAAHVPLKQTSLVADELVWSVVHEGERYFITAGAGPGLIFRRYTQSGSTLYKWNTKTVLLKGSADASNSDEKYITPWKFAYKVGHPDQLKLWTEYGVNKSFYINGSDDGAISTSDTAYFTYKYIDVHTNPNANEEELVKLQFGSNKWLQFDGTKLKLVDTEGEASTFSWSYLLEEYNLLNKGTYPSQDRAEFGYNSIIPVSFQTAYKAYREYTMLLNNKLVDLCRVDEENVANLTSAGGDWKTTYAVELIADARDFDGEDPVSGLVKTPAGSTFSSTITPSGASPTGVTIAEKHVDIVDTLKVTVGLQGSAPDYRFKGDWSGFSSISEANLKIPLVRKTYHEATFDSLVCMVAKDQYNFSFPATLGAEDSLYVFRLSTVQRHGTQMLDVDGNSVAVTSTTSSYVTVDKDEDNQGMHLGEKTLAEVRLVDEYGNTPNWCKITAKGDSTVTVKCLTSGIRSPRSAYLYFAYIVKVDGIQRFINLRLEVSQDSHFDYANNQQLVHSKGASGDEKMANGMQQVHENKRILYYYPDEDCELPIRERAFYGWWRWYRESEDPEIADSDIPDSIWRVPPQNTGRYNFPFRIIGDSVLKNKENPAEGKKLLTMGRYTVFHYKSKDYNNKANPPSKNPRVAPPDTTYGGAHPTLTYVADISNYYDNLPMSMSHKNQVDTAMLDTMQRIPEPTLSLREIFELRPWTEMADTLEHYKFLETEEGKATGSTTYSRKYMEDHVLMAPIGHQLLLTTEQRYNYQNLNKHGLSESLLGYYMRDDNWNKDTPAWSDARKDSMIWNGGWDIDCNWYTYNPTTKVYEACKHSITDGDDFLKVPAMSSISAGHEFDTVYYYLRARSKKTVGTPAEDYKDDVTTDGDYWFNICRYEVIYHNPKLYGPILETTTNGVPKAIITNDEIEQRYEVLERLNFDYNKPGSAYTVYPHPLPWADASYGYTYPETSDLPHNRYHTESDFPNHGEYGLINRIPYSTYWHKMEQHGGAENGYMIYCDGMSSAGQVAALTLHTNLCAGQKMFFSAYVGNPSSQKDKANPNFIFSVQGKVDEVSEWEDITTYMTGDIPPSNQWYQIYFPIIHNRGGGGEEDEYTQFRVRIYNVSSNWDGNDFIIDDMCIFATKPPLIAYQANTTCKEEGDDMDTHVIMRVDYQGITTGAYNNDSICYTVRQINTEGDTSFVKMKDHYLAERTKKEGDAAKVPAVYGKLFIPALDYIPQNEDSIFKNMNELLDLFEATYNAHELDPTKAIFREGYIYETLEGKIRPVKYIVHSANMNPKDTFSVHMSKENYELISSICGMTSRIKVSNRMVLELNGLEQPETEVFGMCANSTYNVSLRVKGSLYLDSVAPIDLNGSCVNDWLLYADTAAASSKERYGYYYSDIKKVITEGLRIEPNTGTNKNQFAPNLSSINKNELKYYTTGLEFRQKGFDPYNMLDSLVSRGFLTLYQSQVTATVSLGDSIQYVIMPIVGTGTDALNKANVEVCPAPIFVKLKPDKGGAIPLMVGGLHRDSTEMAQPVAVLANELMANESFKLRVDSIIDNVGIQSITLRETNDPEFREGIHTLQLLPDRDYPMDEKAYYHKGDSIILTPAPTNNYRMQPGYDYTYNIVMQTNLGKDTLDGGCKVGVIPFTLSVVPAYLRWNPQAAHSNQWNNPDNWLGINQYNVPIHNDSHYAPMGGTMVIIPEMTNGMPYPVVPPMPAVWKDSVQKVNFQYDTCAVIRFLPGAAMAHQQRMKYTNAVIDMRMPYDKWAFRSAPVEGMISGDLFMANADLINETPLWEVGEFDASGRSYTTGNASFWLSLYSRETIHMGHEGAEVQTADADWSKVTNGITLPLMPAQGWAVYTLTSSDKDAVVRLPKNDDIYYYYTGWGEKIYDRYEQNLQTYRNSAELGNGKAGKLAFYPDGASQSYSLTNAVADTVFVFGNPTMGYIDIWGFIADNGLKERFDYMDESGAAGVYTTVTKAAAEATKDTIINRKRYLPPMHAIVLKKEAPAVNSINVTLNTSRVVTDTAQVERPLAAPKRYNAAGRRKGIMTVTAINPVSPICTSRLLLGQGYHETVCEGEDAVLTTICVNDFSMVDAPATPFNLYAAEGNYGLSIDLRDSIVNVPVSFYISDLPYDPVTRLWFTGVNNIDVQLVFYDALTEKEQLISDGIYIDIETPELSHIARYYIRRRGFVPGSGSGPDIPTGVGVLGTDQEKAVKIFKDGHVFIIRNGHVYTLYGQQVK